MSLSGSNLADGPGFDVGIVHGGHGGDGDKRQGRSYGELVVPTEEGRVRVSSARFRQVKGAGHLQQQMRWGGSSSYRHVQEPVQVGVGVVSEVHEGAGDDGHVREIRKWAWGAGAGCAPKGRRSNNF